MEFGSKLAISVVDGYSYMEELRFDPYNEGKTLIDSARRYKEKFGSYPHAIAADKIYRTRKNRDFCKQRSIRLSRSPLGRPTKNKELLKQQLLEEKLDFADRNEVEGKFGLGKRCYGMDLVKNRLEETLKTVVAM